MSQPNPSMSLSNPHPANFTPLQKIALAIVSIGLLFIALAWAGLGNNQPVIFLSVAIISLFVGGGLYAHATYAHLPDGVKNNRAVFTNLTSRGALAWMAGIVFTGFYI